MKKKTLLLQMSFKRAMKLFIIVYDECLFAFKYELYIVNGRYSLRITRRNHKIKSNE